MDVHDSSLRWNRAGSTSANLSRDGFENRASQDDSMKLGIGYMCTPLDLQHQVYPTGYYTGIAQLLVYYTPGD